MNIIENSSVGASALALLLILSPGPRAAEGNPSVEGLKKLVDEVGVMAEQSALGDDAAAMAGARDDAATAIEAGRLHLALDTLVMPLELGPGLIYRAAMTEKIKDQAAFDAEWRNQATLASKLKRQRAAASCTGAPAHVRALAERALNRSAHYYDAALAMAQATEPANGLFYLGRARAQFDLQRICESLATNGSLESPQVHALTGELHALELRTAEEYAKPGAGTEKHGQFIVLNASIKEVLEMNEGGLYHGALYEYLDATLRLGMLNGEPPDDREALLEKATASIRGFQEDGTDHGIVLAFLEHALAALENDDAKPDALATAAVIVEDVAPAYAAVVGTMPKRPRPVVAAHQVAITLVRWPYT
jgi:hypothetical protein